MKLLFIFTFIGIMVFNPPILNNSKIKTDYNKILSNNPVSKGQRLFYIERNQDDRIVCYDTKMLQNGKLNLDNPVDVYCVYCCQIFNVFFVTIQRLIFKLVNTSMDS